MSLLEFEEKGDTQYVWFTDAKILDEAKTQEIGRGLMDFVERAASVGKKIAVDFRGVQFMSSAMIGKLILLNKAVKTSQTDLRLCNVSPNVMQVFRIMRLDKVFRFDIADGVETIEDPVPQPSRPPTDEVHTLTSRDDDAGG